MPNIEDHAKYILRLRKEEELLFWILHKMMEILPFSGNGHQCNIAYGVVHVQLCFWYFVSRLIFVSAASPIVLRMYNFVFSIWFLV